MSDPNHRLASLYDFLQSRILGQENALRSVSDMIIRGELGLTKKGRPKGSALLLGPTGVGKTETVKQCAAHLYGPNGQNRVKRFDMAEFQDSSGVALLLGNIEHRENGLLHQALRELEQEPTSGFLLFDEMEKANQELLTLFLSMLEDARITTADGRTHDLSNYYLLFTSNIGSAETTRMGNLPYSQIRDHVLRQTESRLRPELFARFQIKEVYRPLSTVTLHNIISSLVEAEICFLCSHLQRKVAVDEGELVVQHLQRALGKEYLGARPARGLVEMALGNAVSRLLLRQPSPPDSAVYCVLHMGKEQIEARWDTVIESATSRMEIPQLEIL